MSGRKPSRREALIATLGIAGGLAGLSTGCGYRVSGKADLLPTHIKSIAIPAFGNVTTRYKLTERLPAAIGREFISRTRYRVVADPNEADAILNGVVSNYISYPTVFDTSGRASGIQLSVFLQMTLVERASGAVLYSQPNMEFRQRYEIAVDQRAYFEESDAALERLSGDVARAVVSAILERF
ncbi:MAG: LPS assembly lipoprotein LptE [Bryobacteraceae bacterium]